MAASAKMAVRGWELARRWLWLRLLVMVFGLFALYTGLQLLPLAFVRHPRGAMRNAVVIGDALVVCAGMAAGYVGLTRLFERRAPAEFGLRRGAPFFGAGGLIGAAMFAVTIGLTLTLGRGRILGFGPAVSLILPLFAALAAGVGEEIIFRGALFRLVEEGFGTLTAIVVSALLFGLAHGLNPGATVVSTLAIALEAGVMLALAYVAARSLWLPIGIHFGWNFAEGGVFAQAVSGYAAHGLVRTRLAGPVWLTGGAFGPEASAPAILVCLLVAAAFAAWGWRSGHWRHRPVRGARHRDGLLAA